MRLLVIGYGRMGRLVDQLSESYGFEVAGRLDIDDNHAGAGITTARMRDVDVAIDFSTADAVVDTLPRLAEHGVNLVVGTTGWVAEERALRKIVEDAGIGVVAAANFSLARRGSSSRTRNSAPGFTRSTTPPRSTLPRAPRSRCSGK